MISERLRAQLPAKIAVWLGLAVGICVPYFTLQRLELFPRRSVPVLALDRAIDFEPAWLWAYLSLALLVPLAPLLATRTDELARYARGLALLCLACFAAFLLVPVEGPRPALPPDHGAYRMLVAVDRPANSFPSLHAGLAIYSLLFAWRVVRDDLSLAARRAFAGGGGLWVALILYSTLATRQHWALDLPAGLALAYAAHALAWRSASFELRAATPRCARRRWKDIRDAL
ncbi:MAG TPA: phosphatase PAP2 family protein [Myxococcota bacterium]|nr:phosphatase PAP2 family protein [Myxococcota bacterium]